MPLRLHIWITRATTLLFGGFLLFDLFDLTRTGFAGWLALNLNLLILGGFWVHTLSASPTLSCPLCGRSYGPRILFRMGCPHCGAEGPKDARSPKIIWVPTILLTVLLVGVGLYCRPLSFPDLTQVEGPIRIAYIHDLPTVWEEHVPLPQNETKVLTVEPDSPEAAAMTAVLSRYTYHRCFKTLTKDYSISLPDKGDDSFYISFQNSDALDLNLFSHRHMGCGRQVYHIGWYGNKQGKQLGAELAQALGLP